MSNFLCLSPIDFGSNLKTKYVSVENEQLPVYVSDGGGAYSGMPQSADAANDSATTVNKVMARLFNFTRGKLVACQQCVWMCEFDIWEILQWQKKCAFLVVTQTQFKSSQFEIMFEVSYKLYRKLNLK